MKQEVNVPLILTIGIVGGIMILVAVIGVQAWYQSEENNELVAKENEFPHQELIDLKNGQMDRIGIVRPDGPAPRYHWVDKKNNVVAIPIDAAIDFMSDPAHYANPPATQPATQPTASGG